MGPSETLKHCYLGLPGEVEVQAGPNGSLSKRLVSGTSWTYRKYHQESETSVALSSGELEGLGSALLKAEPTFNLKAILCRTLFEAL